jgi:pectate lyase
VLRRHPIGARFLHISLAVSAAVLVAVVLALGGSRTPAAAEGFTGTIPNNGGNALVVWDGGGVERLATLARQRGCDLTSVWTNQPGGGLVGYIPGAPAVVNGSFLQSNPGGSLAAQTPVILTCAAPDPNAPPPPCDPIPAERLNLLDEREGFGSGATGAALGCYYLVTNAEDAGPGSLREGAERGNQWVVFAEDFLIRLSSPVRFGPSTTIDGRGRSVTITGAGLYAERAENSNIIVTDVRIGGVQGDSNDLLRVWGGATDFWFNHLTLYDAGDEYIDITNPQAPGVRGTVSWVRFDRGVLNTEEKAIIIGDDQNPSANHLIEVTLHHNWYNGTKLRHPLVTSAKVHSYNNLIQWRQAGIEVRHYFSEVKAELVSEHDVFDPIERDNGYKAVFLYDDGFVRIVNPMLLTTATTKGCNRSSCVQDAGGSFVPLARYAYTLDPTQSVRSVVQSGAGWRSLALAP